jgi:cytochrome o ubiquinol oxidase subunit 3
MEKHDKDDRITFGFWIYIMTDLIMFGALFATFAVLRNNTFGGPSGRELFDLQFVLIETLILLTSSFTCGLALLSARSQDIHKTLIFFAATLLLGLSFLAMELTEFSNLVAEGYSWQRSAFLSSFFALVGTHGLHITGGIVWLAVLIGFIIKRGLAGSILRKIFLFSVFWHFLDVVWIFIFTIVYLYGAI